MMNDEKKIEGRNSKDENSLGIMGIMGIFKY